MRSFVSDLSPKQHAMYPAQLTFCAEDRLGHDDCNKHTFNLDGLSMCYEAQYTASGEALNDQLFSFTDYFFIE